MEKIRQSGGRLGRFIFSLFLFVSSSIFFMRDNAAEGTANCIDSLGGAPNNIPEGVLSQKHFNVVRGLIIRANGQEVTLQQKCVAPASCPYQHIERREHQRKNERYQLGFPLSGIRGKGTDMPATAELSPSKNTFCGNRY